MAEGIVNLIPGHSWASLTKWYSNLNVMNFA
jgi:hypothetical protein